MTPKGRTTDTPDTCPPCPLSNLSGLNRAIAPNVGQVRQTSLAQAQKRPFQAPYATYPQVGQVGLPTGETRLVSGVTPRSATCAALEPDPEEAHT